MTRRKVSSGTRSENGRLSRDAFQSLIRTAARHGYSAADYLNNRSVSPAPPTCPGSLSSPLSSSSALTPRHARPAQASPALIPRLLRGAHVPPPSVPTAPGIAPQSHEMPLLRFPLWPRTPWLKIRTGLWNREGHLFLYRSVRFLLPRHAPSIRNRWSTVLPRCRAPDRDGMMVVAVGTSLIVSERERSTGLYVQLSFL